ncbi:hypothetical protein H2200_003613 [Cladophialophora chaetospira]|uniref:Uncharacterized protein n=1 Tax=Cladophialophora chaetospira TaxID=386627 RepID=A0AA39CL93_9EURO|nr:hypothetical protein H2200_003613 [Cladophialophora chaetospira]
MWTQWGARARAAEYNAAKNAAARRTSEEHKLPQKPVPVSLSAFTKNAPVNRNKGTKAFKPLVLEATPEAENDSAQNNDEEPVTPTRLRPTDTTSLSGGSDVKIALSSDSESRPSSVAPTAPKAMLKKPQDPSMLANPTPRRVQPHSIIKQTQQGTTPSVHSSPGNLTRTGGYPKSAPKQHPRVTWYYDLQGYPVIVPFPPVEPMTTPYLGKIMHPDDLSPTKQENKLAAMSREFAAPLPMNSFPQYNHFTPPAGSFANPVVVDDPNFPNFHGGLLSADPAYRPVLQHINSDSVVEVDGNQSEASSLSVPTIVRHYSYPDAVAATPGQSLATDQAMPSFTPRRGHLPVVHSSSDEPYDRKTKMQSFVAAQQALAKTGRTVLHNPDLHRVKASEATSPARSGSTATTPEREHGNRLLTPGSVTILKPPPGFGMLPVTHHASEENAEADPSPINQAALRQIFDVDSEDWLELKPVTKIQRTKMNKVVSNFARAQAPDQAQGFAQKTCGDKKEDLKKWMHVANKDNRPITATQKLFEEAARDRLSGYPTGVNVDGTREDQLSKAEIECAGICAVGDIVANLMDDAGTPGAGKDSDSTFPKYKPAPEYAVERSRLLMGNGGSTSFFEDNTGGFYTAPSRIARDPRFRPAGKEAIQVKPDESWKLRVDMYGRRRM